MQKITPYLWFDGQAEQAAKLYTKVFKRGKIKKVSRWGEGTPAPAGSVMSVEITIEGMDFILFNGGPHFQFSPAISLFVDCKDQKEVDTLWKKLTAGGGQEERCGWLKDPFGVSWQIIPRGLFSLLKSPEAMQAMFKMRKLDIATLKQAAGKSPKKRARRKVK
jgi:predicted 3-demethylubiquinone-9 3-methyltransferase (glyoxalase superfamily)